jgi:hypothetical protein
MGKNGHSMMNDKDIHILKCLFYLGFLYFSGKNVGRCFYSYNNDLEWLNIPSSCLNVVDEMMIFIHFSSNLF